MKIWWPWRRKQKRYRPGQPHSKNAPGDFYVEDAECMTCGYPHVLAPDLDGMGAHSKRSACTLLLQKAAD